MDPLTHGITGALLAKGYFSERHGRAATFAVTLGSVFPDVDIFPELFTRDPLSIIKFHRGFTHSFLALPLFAAVLAWLTRWWERRHGRECPSWSVLAGAYAVGLASHILLDAMTSYGTRLWSPISNERVAWDLLFIVDFGFMAVVLLPQVVAWVYRERQKRASRAMRMWLVFSFSAMAVWGLARTAGFPFTFWGVVGVTLALAALFFLPARREWGLGVQRSSWCRAGVYGVAAYLAACGAAHHAAISRVEAFASRNKIPVVRMAALPLPPTLLSWNGIIRATNGVYQARFDLRGLELPAFRFLSDPPPNRYTAEALALPDIRTYLWFARFPVIHTSQEDGRHIVEFLDLRFFGRRRSGPVPFTFRVVFDAQGRLVEEDWAENALGLRLEKEGAPRRPGKSK